jgi:hypothetical protein
MPPTRDDAEFVALHRNTCAMALSILRAGAALDETQREALIADLRSGDEERGKAALPLLGLSLSALDEQMRLVSNFVAQHPLPDKGPARVQAIIDNAFAAAKLSYSEEEGGGPAPDPLDEILEEIGVPTQDGPDGGGNTACFELCEAEGIALHGLAWAVYVAWLAFCTGTGPGWPICVAAASANYALDVYEADKVIKRCVANCG